MSKIDSPRERMNTFIIKLERLMYQFEQIASLAVLQNVVDAYSRNTELPSSNETSQHESLLKRIENMLANAKKIASKRHLTHEEVTKYEDGVNIEQMSRLASQMLSKIKQNAVASRQSLDEDIMFLDPFSSGGIGSSATATTTTSTTTPSNQGTEPLVTITEEEIDHLHNEIRAQFLGQELLVENIKRFKFNCTISVSNEQLAELMKESRGACDAIEELFATERLSLVQQEAESDSPEVAELLDAETLFSVFQGFLADYEGCYFKSSKIKAYARIVLCGQYLEKRMKELERAKTCSPRVSQYQGAVLNGGIPATTSTTDNPFAANPTSLEHAQAETEGGCTIL